MKKTYVEPEVELIHLNVEDVITSSGLGENDLPMIPIIS